jgi:DNA primase
MTKYAADSRDRVRDAVDMVALVQARTELRRSGPNSYFGVCPFHDERTPSFHVRPDDKHYYCFGCQASGDAFDFVMQTEGLDFVGALESLADRLGVPLQTEDENPQAAARRQRHKRLYTVLERTADYYARYLWQAGEAAPARGYLESRGLAPEMLREFRVGYAPSARSRVLAASRQAGFTDQELLDAGLALRAKDAAGRLFDRFFGRIMFPATDARGRVLGFGARAMREEQRPKYLNTAESELFHKRQQLFGIDLARAHAARAGRMILVEGYTDVLALHQAGLRNAVGIMGTALTDEQLVELVRVVKVLELCLDADSAGQEAMLRAARAASGHEVELRVVRLPKGADPADLILRAGAEALRARVEGSVPFVVFHVERILDRADTRSAEGRDRALTELQPVLAEVPPSVLREELIRQVAGRLELSEGLLRTFIAGTTPAVRPGAAATLTAGRAAPRAVDHGLRAERAFLALCLALPADGEAMLAAVDPDELLTTEPLRRAAHHLTGRTRSPLTGLPADDDELARVVADLVSRAGRARTVSAPQLRHARLILERARLDRAIRQARSSGGAAVPELARRREDVMAEIHELVAQLERAL